MPRRRMATGFRTGPQRRKSLRPIVERVEARLLLADLTVINTNDSGRGSLRDALTSATAGDSILFAIPTSHPNNYNAVTGSWTIFLDSTLRVSTPSILIDALSQQSQPGASAAHPVIVITPSGNFTGPDTDGLDISSSGNTVSGLVINGFPRDGIVIDARASNNLVTGCFIGTDPTGTTAVANGGGVGVGGTSNTIANNLISGNAAQGIFFTAGGNTIQGNRIGTSADGTSALGNGFSGIQLEESSGNTIRGNLVSGNGVRPAGGSGIILDGPQAHGNMIQDNLIGTDAAGTKALPNLGDGVSLENTVGGTVAGTPNVVSGNVISGNRFNGIHIALGATAGNQILGNRIGTDASGDAALGNGTSGITVETPGNTIGGNDISGNGTGASGNTGLTLKGSGADGNVVQGNFIGTNAAATAALPNLGDGVAISGPSNIIGGAAAGDRNIIAGNDGHGLSITGASGNAIVGNYIGTGGDGARALGNELDGIFLDNASGNAISGNLISANGAGQDAAGIDLVASSNGNTIAGNMIGTDATGMFSLGNSLAGIEVSDGSSGNTLGPNNVIAGNGTTTNNGIGVYIFGASTSDNMVEGNAIGTNIDGTGAIAGSAPAPPSGPRSAS